MTSMPPTAARGRTPRSFLNTEPAGGSAPVLSASAHEDLDTRWLAGLEQRLRVGHRLAAAGPPVRPVAPVASRRDDSWLWQAIADRLALDALPTVRAGVRWPALLGPDR